jgi:hypothetical protein
VVAVSLLIFRFGPDTPTTRIAAETS